MNNVQALEEEIVKLSAAELAELREWFAERNAASGKLDQLFEKPAPDQTVGQTNEPKHTEALDSGLLALYSENGTIARAILDWRHRVITLYVLTLGGVGSSFLWLDQHPVLNGLPLTFCLAALIVCLLALMDNTNARVLKGCYNVGVRIEQSVARCDGIYSVLYARSQSKSAFTYTRVLRGLFISTVVVFLSAALFFFRWP